MSAFPRMIRGRARARGDAPAVGSPAVDTLALMRLRAALEAGAAPAAALLLAIGEGPLATLIRPVRLGTPLGEIADTIATGDPAADLLIRALAVVERTGTGAGAAVSQALDAVREEAALDRLLRARTAQARGTAKVLLVVPLVAWLLLVGLDRSALIFYTTPVGVATGLGAAALAAAGQRWSRRLLTRARQTAAAADPLTPSRPPLDRVRLASFALPALLVIGLGLGPLAGVVAAGCAAAVGSRRPVRGREPGAVADRPGGAAETVELLAVAVAAGLSTGAAVAALAALAPPAARPVLDAAARRLRGGWDAEEAFAGTGLCTLGGVLAACDRWGAPAAPALRHLAEELRADRRAAAEEAAERAELALVFPTTLLTLPAFALGVVPPLLWTAFTG